MALSELKLCCSKAPVPVDVQKFLLEAERRIERFQRSSPIPGFVPSDFATAYLFLRGLAESVLAPGDRFCEWGSGFGVVTCLASMIGYSACGIEIEGDLVDEARRLATDFDVPVEFVRGSFIPPGGEACLGDDSDYSWLTTSSEDVSAELGLSADDHDVVFAYPWPDEERAVPLLFDRYAASDAVLVTYHGGEEFRLRRKSGRRHRR